MQVKRRGYNPLVLVTMLDLEDAAIRHKPLPASLAMEHPKVEEALKEVGCLCKLLAVLPLERQLTPSQFSGVGQAGHPSISRLALCELRRHCGAKL